MGSVGFIDIISDDEEIPASGKSPEDALEWSSHLLIEDCKGIVDGLDDSVAIQEFLASLVVEKNSVHDAAAGGDDDDDCIVLDGDPHKALVFAKKKKPGEDGPEEDLQIVAEKGELACRDFPHPRHLCASFPFSSSSHANHCAMCHCYVCDSPAPCVYWVKGSLLTDHCHATDKDAKWKRLRQELKRKSLPASNCGSIQNFFRSSSTTPSSQQYTRHQVAVPQAIPPSRPNVIQSSARRVPAASNVSQNQQMHPSIGVAQNVGLAVRVPKASSRQAIHVPKTSSPRPKMSRKTFKRAGATAQVYAPSNANNLHPAVPSNLHPVVPNYAPMPSASSHVFQTALVAPRSNIIGGTFQGYPPQHSHSAPIVYQGFQVQPTSYLQDTPDRAVGTGMQPFQHSTLTTQGTQCRQDPSADRREGWRDVLASLASDLGVPDYNINPPHGQQSASTQSLHQVKASQAVEPNRSFVASTSQMRPSNGCLLPSHKSGDSALTGSIQTTQPLCLLNSESSLAPSETSLSLVASPAMKH